MRVMGLFAVMLFILAAQAAAQQTETFDWEDGTTTVLAVYPNADSILATNVGAPDPVYGGTRSLRLEDNAASGTPQVYLVWVTGLADGDQVTGSFWRYDDSPSAAPSCRIWGHWNDDPVDLMGYSGSADGNSDYGTGMGWDQTSYTWTVADGHTGLVIEVRTYSNDGDTVWIDDLEVTIPETASFENVVPVELLYLAVE